ncbi:MAG: hypothetical protein IBJ14_05055 [Hydrogenophaga sp.]|nr:hypothetical protein [Hydrogenophaga sp.]
MLALPLLGAAIGSYAGYAAVGWAVGSMLYTSLASRQKKGTPSISEAATQTVMEGAPINIVYGTAPIAGNVIAAGRVRKVSTPIRQGKGGKKTVGTDVQYFCTYAVALCEGPLNLLTGILVAKRDGKIVFDARPGSGMNADNSAFLSRCSIYLGTEDQMPDPALEGIFGVGEVPAMRGTAYIVFRDDDLTSRSGSLPQWEFVIGNGYVPPPFIDQRESRLVSVSAVMINSSGLKNLPGEDFEDTGRPTWSSYFSEFGAAAVLAYRDYNIGAEVPQDTGVQPTKTLPFEPDRQYRVLISSGFWSNGVCPFQFEFLNAAGATVCVVKSQGFIGPPEDVSVPGGGSFRHRVRYGTSLSTPSTAGPENGGVQTSGVFACAPGEFSFTTNSGSSDTSSFTISCNAMSITAVRISNCRVSSNYNLSTTQLPWASILMYRLPTGDDPEPPPDVPEGQVRLSDIVADIHARCGAVEPDASDLDGTHIKGMVLGSADYSGANVIDVLRSAFFFDRIEISNQIVYARRGRASVAAIAEGDLVDANESMDRDAVDEYPRKVLLTAISVSANYETSAVVSQRYSPDVKITGETSVSVPIVMDELEQSRVVAILHKVMWMEAEGEVKFSLPYRWINLVPGDCVTLTLRGHARRIRIDEIKDADHVLEITGKPDRVSAYAAEPNYVLLAPPEPPVSSIPGDTTLAILDIAALRDQDDSLVYYAAGLGEMPAWEGAVLQRSTDAGAIFNDVQVLGPSTVGLLLDNVTAAPEHYTDTTNVVRVQLLRGDMELASLSDIAFLGDAGAFALSRPDGTWEVMQYCDAVHEGNNIYALSTLHRGLLNSGTSDHFSGVTFVLLDTVVPIAAQSIWLGSTLVHRAPSAGQSAEEAGQQSMVYAGISQREWAVAFLNVGMAGATVSGTWAPRHRFGSDVHPLASTNFDGYQVVLDDGTNVETLLVSSPEFTFDASGWDTPINVTVSAVNRITGPGEAISTEVS